MHKKEKLVRKFGIDEMLSYSQRVRLARELGATGVFNDGVCTTIEFRGVRSEAETHAQVQDFLAARAYVHDTTPEILTRR